MEGTYDVHLGNVKMGQVTMTSQGLYWKICCQCTLSGEVMYDLEVSLGECRQKLGLLVPDGSRHCLSVKIPTKKLGQGRPVFSLRPRHDVRYDEFIAISPDEPFAYLRRLQSAYLVRREGNLGISFRDRNDDQVCI